MYSNQGDNFHLPTEQTVYEEGCQGEWVKMRRSYWKKVEKLKSTVKREACAVSTLVGALASLPTRALVALSLWRASTVLDTTHKTKANLEFPEAIKKQNYIDFGHNRAVVRRMIMKFLVEIIFLGLFLPGQPTTILSRLPGTLDIWGSK